MGFSNSGDNNRKKFTGYERDNETSLDPAQARYNSSTLGRFTSPDPFSGSMSAGNPQSFNRYAYVGNNPVNVVDPMGLSGDGPGGSLPGAEGALGRLTGENGVFSTESWKANYSASSEPEAAAGQQAVKKPTMSELLRARWVKSMLESFRAKSPFKTLSRPYVFLSGAATTAFLSSRIISLVSHNEQCQVFLNSVLAQLKNIGVPPISNTFLGAFSALAEDPGFYDDSDSANLGDAKLIGGHKSLGINFLLAKPGGIESLEATTIHETVHGSASRGLYSHLQMATTAFNVGTTMGLVPAGVIPPMAGPSKAADTYNFRLFDRIVLQACGPYPPR